MLWGLQTLITIIEIVGSFIWVRLFIPEKNSTLLRKVVYVAGVMLVTGLTIFQRSIAMYSRHYLLICIVLCSLVCFCRFGCKIRYPIIISFYYETIYCLDLILCILAGYFMNNPYFMLEQQDILKSDRIVIYVITRCTVGVLFFIVYSLREKFIFFLIEKWFYIIPLFEHLFLFGCDTVLSLGKQELAWSRVKLFFIISLLFIFGLIVFYVYSMKKSISELVEMQKSLYSQGYENIILRRLEKERLFHDMKNHLLAIHGMARSGQMGQLESYVDRLCESFDSIQEYTGKQLVDYLISEKVAYAENCGISITLDCGSLSQSRNGQEDIDWTAILGNLWDNAIESCERCMGEKEIRFYMNQRGNIVSIHMENTCPASAKRIGLTTLKNPNGMHGIGMRSIRYVISKYNGSLEWKCQEEKFVVNIIMYM